MKTSFRIYKQSASAGESGGFEQPASSTEEINDAESMGILSKTKTITKRLSHKPSNSLTVADDYKYHLIGFHNSNSDAGSLCIGFYKSNASAPDIQSPYGTIILEYFNDLSLEADDKTCLNITFARKDNPDNFLIDKGHLNQILDSESSGEA